LDADLDPALERLFASLRFRSISTDPAHAADCRACAGFHAADLRSLGFETRVHDTPGQPIVLAHRREGKGTSALFYGAYDVQPAASCRPPPLPPRPPTAVPRPASTRLASAASASSPASTTPPASRSSSPAAARGRAPPPSSTAITTSSPPTRSSCGRAIPSSP